MGASVDTVTAQTTGAALPDGRWHVVTDGSRLHVKTSRLGLIEVQATAPVGGGQLTDADPRSGQRRLTVDVLISQVRTGERFIDPELHALIMRTSDGVLHFQGAGTADEFTGSSAAGTVTLPMSLALTELEAKGESASAESTGSGFLSSVQGVVHVDDMHVPLPGFDRVRSATVTITGQIVFAAAE